LVDAIDQNPEWQETPERAQGHRSGRKRIANVGNILPTSIVTNEDLAILLLKLTFKKKKAA